MSVLEHFALYCIGLAKPETQTTEAERDCLARHAAGKMRVAEIGVWHGVTTCRLLRSINSKGVLFAIDPYPTGRLGFSMQKIIAHREVKKVSNGSVRWIGRTGWQAANELSADSKFDLVFIDGDHSYEGLRADWMGWSELVASGGSIALHDSRSTSLRPIEDAGSVRFTNEVVTKDGRFNLIDSVDSLTVWQRRP